MFKTLLSAVAATALTASVAPANDGFIGRPTVRRELGRTRTVAVATAPTLARATATTVVAPAAFVAQAKAADLAVATGHTRNCCVDDKGRTRIDWQNGIGCPKGC